MNKYQLQHETRLHKIHALFEELYRHHIDDFYESRDQLLKDIEEVFSKNYSVEFKTIAVDSFETEGRKQAKQLLQELCSKL